MTDNPVYDATIEQRQGERKELLLSALKEMPVVQVACKKAGIGRATYYRWRNEDRDFARLCDGSLREGIELVNDMSESQVIQLIKERKLPAITLWLKHNNPRYGGNVASSAPVSALTDLTPEEEKLFKKALALSSGAQVKHQHAKRNRQQKHQENIRRPETPKAAGV